MTNQSAKQTILDLTDSGVPPTAKYTAAAGRDYGHVAAWQLDDGKYVVQYGDNAELYYDYTDNIADLAAWLEYDGLDPIATLLQTARIRGLEAVPAAPEDHDGPVLVLVAYDYYDHTGFDWARDEGGLTREFVNRAEAQAWIKTQERDAYYLAHNEASQPTYKIVAHPQATKQQRPKLSVKTINYGTTTRAVIESPIANMSILVDPHNPAESLRAFARRNREDAYRLVRQADIADAAAGVLEAEVSPVTAA